MVSSPSPDRPSAAKGLTDDDDDGSRFKNYEAAYAKGLTVIEDKDYGSMPSATASTSSVIPTKTETNHSWAEDPSDKDVPDAEAGKEVFLLNDSSIPVPWSLSR